MNLFFVTWTRAAGHKNTRGLVIISFFGLFVLKCEKSFVPLQPTNKRAQKTRIHHQHLISGRGTTGTAVQRYKELWNWPNNFLKKFSRPSEWSDILHFIPTTRLGQYAITSAIWCWPSRCTWACRCWTRSMSGRCGMPCVGLSPTCHDENDSAEMCRHHSTRSVASATAFFITSLFAGICRGLRRFIPKCWRWLAGWTATCQNGWRHKSGLLPSALRFEDGWIGNKNKMFFQIIIFYRPSVVAVLGTLFPTDDTDYTDFLSLHINYMKIHG